MKKFKLLTAPIPIILVLVTGNSGAQECSIRNSIDPDSGLNTLIDSCAPGVGKGELTIDILSLSSEMQETVQAALLQLFPFDTYMQSRPAVSGDSQWGLVTDTYSRAIESSISFPREDVQELVRQANRPGSVDALQIGEEIVIPPLPASPFDDQSNDASAGAQSLHILEFDEVEGWRYYASSTGQSISTAEPDVQLETLWMYRGVPASMRQRILEMMPSEYKSAVESSLYNGPLSQQAPSMVELLQSDAGVDELVADEASIFQPISPRKAAILNASNTGEYQILDFFSKQNSADLCSHGDAVRKAAEWTLAKLGVPSLAARINSIDLDFYSNTRINREYISRYAGKFTINTRKSIMNQVDLISKFKVPAGELRVPLILLHARSDDAVSNDTNVLVMSYSFFVISDGYQTISSNFSDRSEITLLASGKNEPHGAYIEHSTNNLSEPMKTFSQRRLEGKIVVGGVGNSYEPFGSSSRYGTGVTIPGMATEWKGRINCQQDKGNSFSTAQIGALMFAARVYWKESGVVVTSNQARQRLVLSSRVIPELEGKYSAPGFPEPELLIENHGIFAIKRSGEVVQLIPLSDGRMRFLKKDSNEMGFIFPGSSKLFGLRRIDNQFYYCGCTEHDPKWVEVDLLEFSLRTHDHGDISLSSFIDEYIGVISL